MPVMMQATRRPRSFSIAIPTATNYNQQVLTTFFTNEVGVSPTDLGYPIHVEYTLNSSSRAYSSNPAVAALRTGSYVAGSRVILHNQTTIVGAGGVGGSVGSSVINCDTVSCANNNTAGGDGGDAIEMAHNLEINNTGTIAGGGGGGGAGGSHVYGSADFSGARGGGGGGGAGWLTSSGGGLGSRAGNCLYTFGYAHLPSDGQFGNGTGGKGGSGEARDYPVYEPGNGGNGGTAGVAGTQGDSWCAIEPCGIGNCYYGPGGGGGGGWGANGGGGGLGPNAGGTCTTRQCYSSHTAGGLAGSTVVKNGNTLTWIANGTKYGSEGA